ncbi:hypothetical protein [Streptomyces sp. M41(2017)]|uniref:hypothetical protein n=1 Tax=unclassified Streptomyces TaxID=2593676 RepID=UPI0009BE69B4|nr:hypothetical protein [Streptomyces sp. M41(2017)]OQQ19472.1 hypothetical protein B0675_22155 [Streptomyces sp. M41(2017)]
MRAIRVASAALLGVTALTFTAPAAFAGDRDDHNITPFAFSVQPSTIAAGGQVSLLLKRDGGCRGNATVTSGVFDTVTIPPGQSSATAMVDWDARPGAVYDVTFSCGGASGSTGLTIASGRSSSPTPVPLQRGVRAGVGGSVGGFDLKEIGMGAALITGSVGAAWYMVRRRSTSDES